MNQAPNILKKTKDLLVIASNDGRHSTRVYEFRKLKGRPIEMQTRCTVHGVYNSCQVAKNFCLKSLISYEALAAHFGQTEYQFFNGKI